MQLGKLGINTVQNKQMLSCSLEGNTFIGAVVDIFIFVYFAYKFRKVVHLNLGLVTEN